MRKIHFLIGFFGMMLTVTAQAQYRKTVSILGDSYSTFEGYVPADYYPWYFVKPQKDTDVTDVTQTWWHRFITRNGYRLCVNNSFSGSTVCNTGYDGQDFTDRSFVSRMDRLGCPDIIFIFGGTNDSWAGSPLGEYRYADWTKESLFQFRPALAYMLSHMIKRYPNVELYFLLNSGLSKGVNESVRTICRHYGVTCIELKDIDKRSGHPSVKGMEQICRQIESCITVSDR